MTDFGDLTVRSDCCRFSVDPVTRWLWHNIVISKDGVRWLFTVVEMSRVEHKRQGELRHNVVISRDGVQWLFVVVDMSRVEHKR